MMATDFLMAMNSKPVFCMDGMRGAAPLIGSKENLKKNFFLFQEPEFNT